MLTEDTVTVLEGPRMLRRIAVGSVAVSLLLALAGCGGSEASPSASASAASVPASTSAPTTAPVQTAPPATEPPASAAPGAVRLLAACDGVAIRKGPTMTDEVLVRVVKLTKIRVAGTVTGDPYEAVACGTSGASWVKIDRINGTSVQKLYGVKFGYAAAGFFQ
jgi:hypothetical protein